MANRIVIGTRANGDVGVFVSPPGVDANTAPDSSLLLNVISKVSQLILLGSVPAGSNFVPLGLGQKPYIFLTSQWDFAGVVGHTLGSGPTRPSPSLGTQASAAIAGGGASMTISAPSKTTYAIYSQVFA